MRSILLASLVLALSIVACKSPDDGQSKIQSGVSASPAEAGVYFHDTFAASREALQSRIRAKIDKGLQAAVETRRLPSWTFDGELATDFVLFKSAGSESRRLIVVTSGVHGIEGYTASAVQSLFLDEQ